MKPRPIPPRTLPRPLLERPVKRTRFLKPQLLGNIPHARLAMAQLLKRHTTAHFVLDLLIRATFALQFAAEGAGAQVLFEGEGLQGWPLAVMAVAQALVNLGCEAVLVAEADDQPLRRGAQEYFE